MSDHTYTVAQALELARNCRDDPFSKQRSLLPTTQEAIEIIESDPTMHTCTWLTGLAAVAVLKKSLKEGPDATVMVVPGIGVVA